ncbi:hypothetical protein LEN26_008249 [Aphanomyces euteiches]|nr:hypothetical protein AeMF1_002145 [Aphanomyces euteiches]KAH9130732.1 hypothetical protein LEN26_008249 [Aphanomyces euteiches]KAH9185762.1 hypothetical protein AeNC1_012265 [Aphanomyces euteiches]
MENALADEQDTWRKNYLKEVQLSRSLAKRLEDIEARLEAAETDPDAPETTECSRCLVLERELDVLRARHKSLIEKFRLLEEELAYTKKSPLMQLLSPKHHKSTPPPTHPHVDPKTPDKKQQIAVERKALPTRYEIDKACQSVFRANNNFPHVLQATTSTVDTELFHHGILFGYDEDSTAHHGHSELDKAKDPSWLGKILRSPPSSPTNTTSKAPRRKPKVISMFPLSSSMVDVEPMMEFCFPHGDAFVSTPYEPSNDEEDEPTDISFVILLSGAQRAHNMYAICVIPKQRPLRCFCLVSIHPFFSLFFKLLRGVVDMCASQAPQAVQVIFDDALRRLHATAVPPMGGWCCFRLDPHHPLVTFHRPHTVTPRHEERQFILEYTSPLLFSKVSLDHLLVLLGCLCCETKVLLLSDDPGVLTACILALRALLDPYEWAGVVVTILPPSLNEVLEAPVPFLVGQIASKPRRPIPSVVQLFLDDNKLVMHDHEMRVLHELKLPRSEILMYELQADASTCFGCAITPQSLERNQVEACEHMTACIQSHLASLMEPEMTQQAAPFFERFHATQMYSVAAVATTSNDDDDAASAGANGSDLEGESTSYEVSTN